MDTEQAEILCRLDRIETHLKELTHSGGWMDITQVARYSSLSRSSLLRAIRAGHLKGVRRGGKYLINRRKLNQFILSGASGRLTPIQWAELERELV